MSDIDSAVHAALATVIDPEIHRPITDLGMVESVAVDASGLAAITVLLTIAGCPLASTIESDVNTAVSAVAGITGVNLTLGTMSDAQSSRSSCAAGERTGTSPSRSPTRSPR
jgi:ATP-binding protein involved in chromosome partitioning